jgi:probable F420-dependent oxidoreductase
VRYCISLQTDHVQQGTEFVSGAAVAEVARAAEAAGFDAVFVTEHPFPEDAWMASGGHHALDPFVALSFAAAATTRLRVLTDLCVVPYHQPYLLAKAVVSLDALSDGRLILGCGAGYLEPEFAAVGASFDDRNDRFDATIRAMKAAWTGTSVAVAASGAGHTMLPTPVQQPHPPIWIGGNSTRAIRRAVELGDGWMPFPNPAKLSARRRTAPMETADDLARGLDRARQLADSLGTPLFGDVMFAPLGVDAFGQPGWDVDAFRKRVDELERVGVTMVSVHFPSDSRAEYVDRIAGFGAEVLQA